MTSLLSDPSYPAGSNTPDAPWNAKEHHLDTYCDGCGLLFDYTLDEDEEGHEVATSIIPISNAYGDYCSEKCAGEEQ